LPDVDDGQGLQIVVDDLARRHLLRVRVVGGDLRYSRIDVDGTVLTETVATRVSRLAIDEVEHPELALWDGAPVACFYDATAQRMRFAERVGADDWQVQDLAVGGRDGCSLLTSGADRWVVWAGSAGDIRAARRTGANTWAEEVVAVDTGTAVDAEALSDGRLVVAFGDPSGALNISIRAVAGGWTSDFTYPFSGGWGWEPSIIVDGASFTVVHGLFPEESDSGVVRTTGEVGAWVNEMLIDGAYGGSIDARLTSWGETVAARELSRSALFGQSDGLHLYPAVGARTVLEWYSQAAQRHRFESVDLAVDPFGEPVVAAFDQRSPFVGLEEGGFVCVWNPDDQDADGVPDVVEAQLGTDPALADTDGDGRTDGEELLVDDTDPLVGPPAPDVLAGAGVADEDADGLLGGESNLVPGGDLESAGSWLRYGSTACQPSAEAAGQGGTGMECGPGGAGTRVVRIPVVAGGNYRVRFANRLVTGALYAFVGTTHNGSFSGLPGATRTRSTAGGWQWSELIVRAPADVQDGLALYFLATDEADIDAVSVVALAADDSALANGDLTVPGTAGWLRYGTQMCAVANGQFSCDGAGVQQVAVPVGISETWRLRFQARHRSGTIHIFMGVDDPEAGFVALPGGVIQRFSDGGAEWGSVDRVFALPAALSGPVRFVVYVDGDADLAGLELVPVAPGQNLMVDGDFETESAAAWKRAWSTACTLVGVDQGLRCGAGAAAMEQKYLALQPNTTYRLDVSYQLSAGQVGMQIVHDAGAGEVLLPGASFQKDAGTGAWASRSVIVRTPAVVGPARMLLYGSGDAIIDDVSLVEVAPLGELVVDGSFEGAADQGWVRYGRNACRVEAGPAYDGSKAMVCDPGSQRLSGIALVPGETFRFSVAWRDASGSAWAYLGLRGADGSFTPVAGTTLQTSAATGEWNLHERTFVAPDAGAGSFEIIVVSNGSARFDAISVAPVP
jgi:hypothetical protein